MPQAIQLLGQSEKSALMQWLTRYGPFWEDKRGHGPDDYLECNDQVVTDTAVGEAAFHCFQGADYQLVSLIPSSWEHTPLFVWWRLGVGNDVSIRVANYITVEDLGIALRSASVPIASWDQLALVSQARFPKLNFSATAFDSLRGLPLAAGAAQRIIERLDVLEQLKCCFDQNGERTPEGHRLYQEHFTGDKAWFSDSSDREKVEFRSEMTFNHPEIEGETMFCTMHAKVKTPQFRIHFSWPVQAGVPLYVVYVGPKITKC